MKARRTTGARGWVLCLRRTAASALGPLRIEPGIEVGEQEEMIWVRSHGAREAVAERLARLPVEEHFEWQPPDALWRLGARIPWGVLPVLSWRPLSTWLSVDRVGAALPGRLPPPQCLRLEADPEEGEPTLLELGLGALEAYAEGAARIRLARLRFAVHRDGRAWVRGTPLPPISGPRWVFRGRIAVPAGTGWFPRVPVAVVEEVLRVGAHEVLVWLRPPGIGAGQVVRLHEDQFVEVSPGALRATRRGLLESR